MDMHQVFININSWNLNKTYYSTNQQEINNC